VWPPWVSTDAAPVTAWQSRPVGGVARGLRSQALLPRYRARYLPHVVSWNPMSVLPRGCWSGGERQNAVLREPFHTHPTRAEAASSVPSCRAIIHLPPSFVLRGRVSSSGCQLFQEPCVNGTQRRLFYVIRRLLALPDSLEISRSLSLPLALPRVTWASNWCLSSEFADL
jgi:hypothetical protein